MTAKKPKITVAPTPKTVKPVAKAVKKIAKPKKITHATGIVKPVKVKGVQNDSDKKLRGLSPTMRAQLNTFRKHIVNGVECRKQCDITLGNIPCDGSAKCYICTLELIPHYNVYNKNCRTKTHSIWKNNLLKVSLDTNAGYYPECEHIMPCKNTTIHPQLDIWFKNIILYKHYVKIIKDETIPQIDISVLPPPIITSKYVPSSAQKRAYFLNIILRMNYAWSHKTCNGLKTNDPFVSYNPTTKVYSTDQLAINIFLNSLITLKEKLFDSVYLGLNDVKKSSGSNNYTTFQSNELTLINSARTSMKKRIDYVVHQLNNAHNILGQSIESYIATGGSGLTITHIREQLINLINGKSFVPKEKIIRKINNIKLHDDEKDDFLKNFEKFIDQLIDDENIEENLDILNKSLDYYNLDIDKRCNLQYISSIKRLENLYIYRIYLDFLSFEFDDKDINEKIDSELENVEDPDIMSKINTEYKKFISFNLNDDNYDEMIEEIVSTTEYINKCEYYYLIIYFKELVFKMTKKNLSKSIDMSLENFKKFSEDIFYKLCLFHFVLSISYGSLNKFNDEICEIIKK